MNLERKKLFIQIIYTLKSLLINKSLLLIISIFISKLYDLLLKFTSSSVKLFLYKVAVAVSPLEFIESDFDEELEIV